MSQIKIQKIEKLFNQSVKSRQRCIKQGFQPLCNMSDYIAQSILNGNKLILCGNDFGYDQIYKRMIESLGKEGDCLIAITTSGNSKNVILAMKAAKIMGIKVYGFLGSGGGKALEFCDEAFVVPSDNTGRVQEVHITAGHALMECVEDNLLDFGYLTLQI